MEIKITVLVDNYTYIDEYYLGEPAVSYYIEIDQKAILFDAGYSDVALKNAEKMGIDLSELDYIVLSHGHNDHTRGLKYLAQQFDLSNVKLIAHPHCFLPKREGGTDIGAPFSTEEICRLTKYCPITKPYELTSHCAFLGEIPRITSFEGGAVGEQKENGIWEQDMLLDDSAIMIKTAAGLFIVTGCSHSGICNIIEHAKKVGSNEKIIGVIGGFHLLTEGECLEETLRYLECAKIEQLYPCHCISFQAKAKLNKIQDIHEVGVGMKITLTI